MVHIESESGTKGTQGPCLIGKKKVKIGQAGQELWCCLEAPWVTSSLKYSGRVLEVRRVSASSMS